METSITSNSPVREDQCKAVLHSGKRCSSSRFAWVQKGVERGGQPIEVPMQVCEEHAKEHIPKRISIPNPVMEEDGSIKMESVPESQSPWAKPELGEWAEDQIDNAIQNLSSLTPQQRRVFDLLMEGKTEREIGKILNLSRTTVQARIAWMRNKLTRETVQDAGFDSKYAGAW